MLFSQLDFPEVLYCVLERLEQEQFTLQCTQHCVLTWQATRRAVASRKI